MEEGNRGGQRNPIIVPNIFCHVSNFLCHIFYTPMRDLEFTTLDEEIKEVELNTLT